MVRNPARRLVTSGLSFRPNDDIDHIAAQVRDYLGISLEQQHSWGDAQTALNKWLEAFLHVGAYVFKDQFRDNRYSGFCLYHEEFPIIYVNNTAAKTRQIFTLFHELAQLLFHSSGLDTPEDDHIDDLPPDHRSIEVICNRLAARLLLLDAAFDRALDGKAVARKWTKKWTEEQAKGRWREPLLYEDRLPRPEYIRLAFQRYYQNQIDNVAKTVLAPMKSCSGASMSISSKWTNKAVFVTNKVYAMDATPADIIYRALTSEREFSNRPFNLVLVGCNAGANLGFDIGIRGTVGAAMVAAKGLGVCAMAFSQDLPEGVKPDALVRERHFFAQR